MSDLSLRAAYYFGLQDKPRTSISVGRNGCLIVADGYPKDRKIICHYDEEFQPRGTFVKLTPKQRERLIAALDTQERGQ